MMPLDLHNKSPEELRQLFDMLYEAVLKYPEANIKNDDDFSDACHVLVRLCLSVNDYIHANNVLQCYKSQIKQARASWYHLYGLMIYGKRQPRYFMRKPTHMTRKINRFLKDGDPPVLHRCLMGLLMFYVKLFNNYDVLFEDDLRNFVEYFHQNPLSDFKSFNKGIAELIAVLDGKLEYEDITFDLKLETVSAPKTSAVDARQMLAPHRVSDKVPMVYDAHPKILILGDLRVKRDVVYALAKRIGFTKQQIEIYDDYEKIKTFKIHKYRHNPRYCGLIFGPMPHSTKSTGDASSLIAQVTQTEGYPYHVNGTAGKQLKLTKQALENCLRDVHNHYESTRI